MEYNKLLKYIKNNETDKLTTDIKNVLGSAETFLKKGELIAQTEPQIKCHDTVLLYGQIGNGGASIIAEHKKAELFKLPEWFLNEGMKLKEASLKKYTGEFDNIDGIKAVIPVCEGGLYKALFTLWEICSKGFEIDYEKVETDQLVIEICEHYDMDPWRLLSGGCALVVSEKPGALKDKCVPIGYMNDCKDKLIVHREVVSRLDRPKKDEIFKIL